MINRRQGIRILTGIVTMLLGIQLIASDAMAAKAKFERNKPHVNVGTIGHVDKARAGGQIPQTRLQQPQDGGQASSSNSNYKYVPVRRF